MHNFKDKKIFVCGVTGSGKTYFTENKLIKSFKKPLIYTIHKEDFKKAHKGALVYYAETLGIEELENLMAKAKTLAKNKEIDAIIIDEADMYVPKNVFALQGHKAIYDMLINHRHYGIALVMITRRPQEINTAFIEQCHHIFVFALEGKNVKQHLNYIHEDFESQLEKIEINRHNFIHKEIGKKPYLCSPVKVKGG